MKIAIASGKGGTGKTTLSTNLASFLGKERRVVLVDLDVEEPNSKLFMQGEMFFEAIKCKMIPAWDKSTCSLCGKCVEICNYNALLHIADEILIFPNLCHSCYACSELCPTHSLPMNEQKMGELRHWIGEGVDFVEGRLNVGEEQAVSLIAQTKKYVEKHFSDDTLTLYDSPPGTSCPMIEAVKDADFVILVTEPTPFGLHDLKLAVETIRIMNKKFGVVINRFGIGNDAVEAYCLREKIDILAKIEDDRAVASLYSRGILVYDKVPSFKQSLQQIVEYIDNFEMQRSSR